MNYFKYGKVNKLKILADKEYLKSLGKDKEKKIIRSRRLVRLLSIIGVLLFIFLFGLLTYLIALIPIDDSFLRGITSTFLEVIALILSILAVIFTVGVLIKKVEYNYPQMHKEYIARACADVRRYYKLNDNYLITKCFDSTNKTFNMHDVCIFRYNNEIRITSDIVRGFINSHCDLGCYSIDINDLVIFKDDFNGKRATIIEFENIKFVIGIKAYSFLMKIINQENM